MNRIYDTALTKSRRCVAKGNLHGGGGGDYDRLRSFAGQSEDECVVTVCSVGHRSHGDHSGNACEMGALHIPAPFPECRSNVYGSQIL